MAHFPVRHPFGPASRLRCCSKSFPTILSNRRVLTKASLLLIKQKAPIGSLLFYMAEREGFEPSIRDYRIHTFQACSFNHSDTSPDNLLIFNELAVRKARDSITISRKFTESDMEIFRPKCTGLCAISRIFYMVYGSQ
jgi:hypothetical protein